MAGQQTLNWTLSHDRGTITFGRPLPFSGGKYRINVSGAESGAVYTFYLMDDSGLNCLAKSSYDGSGYTITFDSEALRDEFIREPHEARPFHCFARSGTLVDGAIVEANTVAEGDLTIIWNPLWTDYEVGAAYTMQGREGRPGKDGRPGAEGPQGLSAYDVAVLRGFSGTVEEWIESLRGQPGRTTSIHSPEDNLWRNVTLVQDDYAQWNLRVDPEGKEINPDDEQFVSRTSSQTVEGLKTFTINPIVPDPGDEEHPQVAPPAGWVRRTISAALTALRSSAQQITAKWQFHAVRVENNLAVAPEGSAVIGGTLAVNGTESHSGQETHTGSETHEGAESHSGSESHAGPEEHTGVETHNGDVTVNGQLTASNVTRAWLSLDNADFDRAAALNCADLYALLNLVLQRCNGNWLYFAGKELPEGYCGSTASAQQTNTAWWRDVGLRTPRSGDVGASGLFGLVTETIGRYACYSQDFLRRIDFPNVTAVGDYAFYGAEEMESISLPKVVTIGAYAFSTCGKFTNGSMELYFPSIEEIGYSAFQNTPISEVRMPNKTAEGIKSMANFPWGAPAACRFIGSDYTVMGDGTIVQ